MSIINLTYLYISRISLIFWAAFVSLLLLACSDGGQELTGGTGIGNPPIGNAKVSILASTNLGAPPLDSIIAMDGRGTTFRIHKAAMNVNLFKFELPDTQYCGHEKVECEDREIKRRGPFIMDLLTGASTPPFETFSVPQGNYNEFEFKTGPAGSDNFSVEENQIFQSYGLVISGLYNTAAQSDVPFHIYLKFVKEIEFESENDLSVTADSVVSWMFQFDLSTWFSGTQLSNCPAQSIPTGLIIDDANPCSAVRQSIETNIARSTSVEVESEDD